MHSVVTDNTNRSLTSTNYAKRQPKKKGRGITLHLPFYNRFKQVDMASLLETKPTKEREVALRPNGDNWQLTLLIPNDATTWAAWFASRWIPSHLVKRCSFPPDSFNDWKNSPKAPDWLARDEINHDFKSLSTTKLRTLVSLTKLRPTKIALASTSPEDWLRRERSTSIKTPPLLRIRNMV